MGNRINNMKTPSDAGVADVVADVDETKELLPSEEEGNLSRPTVKNTWSRLFTKLFSKVRSYASGITEDDFTDDQHLVSKLYAAANKTETKASMPLTFEEDYLHGFDTTATGNITFDFTGAKLGTTVVVKHNAGTAPNWNLIPEARFTPGSEYQTGVNNYIIFRYYAPGLVVTWIHQEASSPTANQVGGAVDGHTHNNLNVLNAISAAGSGSIITQAERDKLASLNVGFRGWFATASALNTAIPSGNFDDSAIVGDTDTFWIWNGSAWTDTGSNNSSTAITAAEVKTKYESNSNTNAFTDAEKSKLALVNPTSYQTIPNIISANVTAANDRVYHNTANATYTDPTGVEGKGYIVRVLAGTATVGGVGYVAGDIVTRMYIGAAWVSRVYQEPASGGGGGWTLVQTVTAVGSETQLEFTGLDGDADDDDWMIEFYVQSTTGAPDMQIRFNNDSTSGDYKTGGTSQTELTLGTALDFRARSTHFTTFKTLIPFKASDADVGGRGIHIYAGYDFTSVTGGTANQLGGSQDAGGDPPGAYMLKTNITSIQVFNASLTAFAAGSEIRLYKGKA